MSGIFSRGIFGSRSGGGTFTETPLNSSNNVRLTISGASIVISGSTVVNGVPINKAQFSASMIGEAAGWYYAMINTTGTYAFGTPVVGVDIVANTQAYTPTPTYNTTKLGYYYNADFRIIGAFYFDATNILQTISYGNLSNINNNPCIDNLEKYIEVNSIPIGMPFPQWFEGNLSSVVAKYPTRFIKLSKDSAYNAGKLTSQTAHTADETTFYTATISDAGSPLNGESVTLINSTENTTGGVSAQPSFLGAGETSQTRLANRLQGHRHEIALNSYGTLPDQISFVNNNTGLLSNSASLGTAITDTFNGTPRLGKTNQPDAVTAVWYMRIK